MCNRFEESSKKVAKSSKSYFCEICDYYTSRKNNLDKHFKTKKHREKCNQNVTFCNIEKVAQKHSTNIKVFNCDNCGKTYKSRMGLWRHKKKCEKTNEFITMKKDEYIKVLENVSQKSTVNNIQTQNNTQNISINLFLNEQCKNAMCLEDFIKGVNLTLEDIVTNQNLGYADNMSNVLIKNLENMPGKERPIHSTDVKRLKFMVKKADGWKKDDGTEVDNAVREVKFKQISKINEWENNNPGFQEDAEKMKEWNSMMSTFDSGESKKEKEKNSKCIKKKLAEAVNIKDIIQDDI